MDIALSIGKGDPMVKSWRSTMRSLLAAALVPAMLGGPGSSVAAALSLPGKDASDRAAPPEPRRDNVTDPLSSYHFGTLLTSTQRLVDERGAGVRVVHLEMGWNNYEPQDGVFNPAYVAQTRERLRAMQTTGMEVVLGIGLQYPPAWVYTYANSRYVDQYGTAASPVNLTFNQALREKVERYIARVDQDLGLHHFAAVRVGSGGLIESLYPEAATSVSGNSYWAYDGNAQGGPGRPASIPPSPLPGWTPGNRTYDGQPLTPQQVEQWYEWYLGALTDGINWQLATYRRLGYAGEVQILMPGIGSRPADYRAAIANYLDGTGDANRTMSRGAVWHRIIDGLTDRWNVVIYVSSLADGSGNNDACEQDDVHVSLDDPVVNTWSAARWLSYNADRYGLSKNGENPGRSDTNGYGPAMMAAAARQMESCGFQGMMWAHDSNLYDGTSGVDLTDYAALIVQH